MFKKIKSLSVKTKITISVFTITLFICVVASVAVYFYLLNNLTVEKINNIQKINTEQVHESTQIIEKDQLFAKMLGTRTRVKEFLLDRTEARRVELLGIFNDYAKDNPKYLSIYLLDTKGIGLISTDPRFVGQDYSFRDYFQNALIGKPYIDDAIGKTTNQFGYYFSYPVKDDKGAVVGVLVVKVDNKEIDNAVLISESAKDSTIMLVDQFGIILVSNRPERFLMSLGEMTPLSKETISKTERYLNKEIKPLQYIEAQKLVDRGQSGTVSFHDAEDGEDEIVSVAKFPDLPFYLVSEIGVETVSVSVMSIILIIISIFTAGIIIGSIIIYRLLVRFISPLQKFEMAAQAINKGDYSHKVDIVSGDEFGNLAAAFNSMVTSLSDTYKALDQKVQERTMELQKTLANQDIILDQKVQERTAEIKHQLAEVEEVNKIMLGREAKMADLKRELEDLKAKNYVR